MTHVLIAGKTGRMAQNLLTEAKDISSFTKVSSFGRKDSPNIQEAHVMIDFSHPEALSDHLKLLNGSPCALLVGTTGLTTEQMNNLKRAAQNRPILYASNTGLGIPLLEGMLKHLGKSLNDFNCHLEETHHVHKKDAPSGTALSLASALKDGGYNHQVDIKSNREGEVIGIHTLTFSTPLEEITISHRAIDRRLFAVGALKAALWLTDQKPGFYNMCDFLSINPK